MKTNKILMAMVLAAGFTACTSEDVVESTQNALSNRKELGDIEFVIGEGVDSRFALENGEWKIEAGDAFGAVLVDEPNGKNNENAWENYNLTNYIQTNYRYAKGEGDVFTTPARLVEGNYVFYAPYNAKHLSRKPMEVAFPISQTLDVVDGKVNPFSPINNAIKEGYPFFVDYKFLSAEDQETSLTLNFKHLYAYPEVTFANETEEDITIEKFIVALPTTKAVTVSGTLDLVGGLEGKVAAANATGVVGNLFNLGTEKTEANSTSTTAHSWGAWVNYLVEERENNLIYGTTADMTKDEKVSSTHVTIDVPEGLTVEAGEEVKFYIVLPAQQASAEVFAMVNVEEGYKATISSKTLLPGQRYPKEDFKTDGSLRAQDKVGLDYKFKPKKDTDLKDLTRENIYAPVVVSTTTELIEAIGNAEGTLAIIAGEEVVYNKSVVDARKDSEVENINVLGDLTIAGTTDSAKPLELKALSIKGTATIKSGYVNSKVDLNDVVVAEDATLDVNNEVKTLTNNGTVDANKGAIIASSTTKALNYGTMNIEEKTAKVYVRNENILNVKAAATLVVDNFEAKDTAKDIAGYKGTVNVKCDFTYGALNGDWNVDSGKTLKVSTAATIAQTVKVTGKIIGEKLTIVGGGLLEVEGRVDNAVELKGTIDADSETDGKQPSIATLTLKEGAYINGEVTNNGGDKTCNLFKIEDDVEFLYAYTAKTAIKSQYTYSGNFNGDTENDPTIPVQCNALSLTGDVTATKDNITFAANLTDITINGGVLTNGYDVTFNAADVSITQDVENIDGTIDFKSAKVTINGNLSLKERAGVLSANRMTVKKEVIAGETIDESKSWGQLCVQGGMTIAEGKTLYVNRVCIEGNVILSGKGTLKTGQVDIYEGCEFEISANSIIDKQSSGVSVVFASYYEANCDADPVDEDDIEDNDLERGTVVNNGTVTNAAIAYGDTTIQVEAVQESCTWWSGKKAVSI